GATLDEDMQLANRVKHWLFHTALAVLVLLCAGAAQAEKRAAIVVGNSEYPFAPLTNPRSDAKLIANTLTELNFDVLLFYDVKKSAAKDLIDIVKNDPVGVKLFILDACRNNPAAKEKGLQQGLAYTEAGSGQVLVAF